MFAVVPSLIAVPFWVLGIGLMVFPLLVGLLTQYWTFFVKPARRARVFRQWAEMNGRDILTPDEVKARLPLDKFPMTRAGRVMRRPIIGIEVGDGRAIILFDYHYCTRNTGGTKLLSLLAVDLRGRQLPDFALWRRTLNDRLNGWTGKHALQPLPLDDIPGLSSRYQVFTRNARSTLRLVHALQRAVDLTTSDWSLECVDGWMLMYRFRRVLRADEVNTAIDDARMMADVLQAHAATGASGSVGLLLD